MLGESQKKYHETALKKTELKDQRDGHISKGVLIITILAYVAALVFELVVYRGSVNSTEADSVRVVLKVLLGTMSAVTLFVGNYYGKQALSNVIDDHRKMAALYDEALHEIERQGETEDILVGLARDELNENANWYAYQSKNEPDLGI